MFNNYKVSIYILHTYDEKQYIMDNNVAFRYRFIYSHLNSLPPARVVNSSESRAQLSMCRIGSSIDFY